MLTHMYMRAAIACISYTSYQWAATLLEEAYIRSHTPCLYSLSHCHDHCRDVQQINICARTPIPWVSPLVSGAPSTFSTSANLIVAPHTHKCTAIVNLSHDCLHSCMAHMRPLASSLLKEYDFSSHPTCLYKPDAR